MATIPVMKGHPIPEVEALRNRADCLLFTVSRFRFRFNRLFFIVIMQLRLRKNICHINKSCFSMNHSLIDHKLTL